MENLSTTLDVKSFNTLLNGLNQLLFGGDTEDFQIGVQLLQDKVFKNSTLDAQEQRNEISLFEAILRRAAQDNWSVDEVEDFLSRRSFSSDHSQIFIRFWSKESPHIHKSLLKRATFNNTLDTFSWRVDMNAMSKSSAELNEPIASFELNFSIQAKPVAAARFDMSRDELTSLLDSMQSIQSTFETIIQQGGSSK